MLGWNFFVVDKRHINEKNNTKIFERYVFIEF